MQLAFSISVVVCCEDNHNNINIKFNDLNHNKWLNHNHNDNLNLIHIVITNQ